MKKDGSSYKSDTKPVSKPVVASNMKPPSSVDNNSSNFRCSSPIVNTVLSDKLNKVVSIENNFSNINKKDENENDFLSNSSDEYFYVKPVEKIFNESKDKETCMNLFGVLIKKFQSDIMKLKEAKQNDSNCIIDEYNEKENYVQVLENIMNKYLK